MSDDKPSYKGYVNRKFTASEKYRKSYDNIFGKKTEDEEFDEIVDEMIEELKPTLDKLAEDD